MSIQAAKEELNSLTEFQRDIHVTTEATEEIISSFHRVFIKSTWHSSVPVKLKRFQDGEETVYAVSDSFHFLMHTYMRFTLPRVRVKPEYRGKVRICWCHNVGTNIVGTTSFKEDDETFHTWDSVWADYYYQFFQDGGAGKRKSHHIGIGNIECLENWSEFLPEYTINVDQPWFYSMDTALGFPILYKGSLTRAEHRYTLKLRVADLLRVQVLGKDKEWKDCKRRRGMQYLDIIPDLEIATPELWGKYAYITEPEIKWHKECGDLPRVLYTRDVEVCDTPNPSKYGEIAEILLQSSTPCMAILWAAENQDAKAINNHSNYTTDFQDLYAGWDPIKTTGLKYGTVTRLPPMGSDHFSLAEARKHFPSSPSERGYHAYSYANDSSGFHGDVGIVLENMKAKLFCRIENNDLFLGREKEKIEEEADGDEDSYESKSGRPEKKISMFDDYSAVPDLESPDNSPSFITRVRLLVMRKFEIKAENGLYKFTIE